MISLQFRNDSPLRILCLGAHCDDIEIGCGASLLNILEQSPNSIIYWVVFGSTGIRAKEAIASAEHILRSTKKSSIIVKNFRTSYFPYEGAGIKDYFEEIKDEFQPDLVFSHYGKDRHQDHKLISQLTWNTFRDHAILEYEVPKYDGGLGSPQLFIPITEENVNEKVRILMTNFQSQKNKPWFTESTFLGLMRLRGLECNSPSGYAESFYTRKMVLEF